MLDMKLNEWMRSFSLLRKYALFSAIKGHDAAQNLNSQESLVLSVRSAKAEASRNPLKHAKCLKTVSQSRRVYAALIFNRPIKSMFEERCIILSKRTNITNETSKCDNVHMCRL